MMKRTVSAMEFRRNLGEILEGVLYRGDEVRIERHGKLMGVVISPEYHETMKQGREHAMDRLSTLLEENWARNKDLSPEAADELAIEAVRWARRKSTKRKIAS
ncbi:MAG: type II toxin-antitoxin system Phd/YefM family antitoxin [Chloroflexota bacterium]|nr:type II toxin-antitoxin system Phd/YefM family antitoxin [Chloroflexota bacterium]